jgi:hypothetical protein
MLYSQAAAIFYPFCYRGALAFLLYIRRADIQGTISQRWVNGIMVYRQRVSLGPRKMYVFDDVGRWLFSLTKSSYPIDHLRVYRWACHARCLA